MSQGVSHLLAEGVDVNCKLADGHTLLMAAAQQGDARLLVMRHQLGSCDDAFSSIFVTSSRLRYHPLISRDVNGSLQAHLRCRASIKGVLSHISRQRGSAPPRRSVSTVSFRSLELPVPATAWCNAVVPQLSARRTSTPALVSSATMR